MFIGVMWGYLFPASGGCQLFPGGHHNIPSPWTHPDDYPPLAKVKYEQMGMYSGTSRSWPFLSFRTGSSALSSCFCLPSHFCPDTTSTWSVDPDRSCRCIPWSSCGTISLRRSGILAGLVAFIQSSGSILLGLCYIFITLVPNGSALRVQ